MTDAERTAWILMGKKCKDCVFSWLSRKNCPRGEHPGSDSKPCSVFRPYFSAPDILFYRSPESGK